MSRTFRSCISKISLRDGRESLGTPRGQQLIVRFSCCLWCCWSEPSCAVYFYYVMLPWSRPPQKPAERARICGRSNHLCFLALLLLLISRLFRSCISEIPHRDGRESLSMPRGQQLTSVWAVVLDDVFRSPALCILFCFCGPAQHSNRPRVPIHAAGSNS